MYKARRLLKGLIPWTILTNFSGLLGSFMLGGQLLKFGRIPLRDYGVIGGLNLWGAFLHIFSAS